MGVNPRVDSPHSSHAADEGAVTVRPTNVHSFPQVVRAELGCQPVQPSPLESLSCAWPYPHGFVREATGVFPVQGQLQTGTGAGLGLEAIPPVRYTGQTLVLHGAHGHTKRGEIHSSDPVGRLRAEKGQAFRFADASESSLC